jgi:hypothetical protein
MNKPLDIAIVNAHVYTLNDMDEEAEAVGISGKTISVVGHTEEVTKLSGENTRLIDAKRKVVLPGFIDSHCHLAFYGLSLSQPDLRGATSKDEVLDLVRRAAREKEKGHWIIVDYLRGWQESKWKGDKTYIRKEELNQVAPENPTALSRIDGHLCSVNSKALEILNIPVGTLGYEVEAGEPTGILREPALHKLDDMPDLEPGVEELVCSLRPAIKKAHELGVTSVHEMKLQYKNREIRAYRELQDSGELQVRVSLSFEVKHLDEMINLGLSPRFGDEKLRLGAVKIFLDGSKAARTAALIEPYHDAPSERGTLLWKGEELENRIIRAHQNDIQLAIHSVGDRATELVLNCFEKANQQKRKNLRHRIEHLAVASRSQIERVKNLDLMASMQPSFLQIWGLPGGDDEARLGTEKYQQANPYAWVIEQGIKLAFGSDVLPFSPLFGIHCAANAAFSSQKLSPKDAFRAYTRGGAYATFEEELKGSIEEGKLADLIIMSQNPFFEPHKIKDMDVELTIFDGKIVYDKLKTSSDIEGSPVLSAGLFRL